MSIGYKDPQMEIIRLQSMVRRLEDKRSKILKKGELEKKIQELRKANWDLTFALMRTKEKVEQLEEELWITKQKQIATKV